MKRSKRMAKGKNTIRTVRVILWILVAIFALGAIYLFVSDRGAQMANGSTEAAQGEDAMGSIGGSFSLVTPSGDAFTEADLVGKPHVMFFGFTRCPDVCPTALQRMTKLRRDLSGTDDERPFEIIFVSVDPEHDTPQVVGDYVDLFGTPIIGLTGTAEQVDQIRKAYGVYAKKRPMDNGDYSVDHSATVYLIDAQGQFAGTIATDESDEVALQKLQRLTE